MSQEARIKKGWSILPESAVYSSHMASVSGCAVDNGSVSLEFHEEILPGAVRLKRQRAC